MTFANGLVTVFAGGLAVTFTTGLLGATLIFVAAGWPITIADAGAFIPLFEAVPLGQRWAAIDFSAACSLALAAVGLAITFAAGLLIFAAGCPISVADAGVFNPIFEAVPLGRPTGGMDLRMILSLPFAAVGDGAIACAIGPSRPPTGGAPSWTAVEGLRALDAGRWV
jgi:hypothetical protein